jgi:hypothetical protein
MFGTLVGSPAFAFTPPEGHEKFLEDEDYKNQFERFTATMEEAKERLAPDEYKALEKETDKAMAQSVKEDMESGSSEAEAWSTAYIVGAESVGQELTFDWLRKNAKGVQGYYKLKSDAFDGYMTIQEGDEENFYAVYIFAIQERGASNSGEVEGGGKLDGGKILVDYGADEPAATVTFDGETATVATSEAFKASGWIGNGVTLDGEYAREKK